MQRTTVQRLFYGVLLFVLCGCSQLNGTRLEPVLGGDIDLVALGDEVANHLLQQPVPPLSWRGSR